jgi:N-glycosylase/DNA lyase
MSFITFRIYHLLLNRIICAMMTKKVRTGGEKGGNGVKFETLGQTLDCGQSFRWRQMPDGAWEGAACGRYLRITKENLNEVLHDEFWARYFDMDLDYAKIRAEFCTMNTMLAQAAEYAPDIRILNQDPWEALCSFILSQCNNVGRIKGLVERLSTKWGEPINDGHFAFPSPEALAQAGEAELRSVGCGFRAAYVAAAAKQAAEGKIDWNALRSLPLDEARQKLTELPSVGPKVADCALLYGLHRLDAFPMDVWMKRAMKTLFPGKNAEDFGPYAGIAQQYIFHYSRNHPELFHEPLAG